MTSTLALQNQHHTAYASADVVMRRVYGALLVAMLVVCCVCACVRIAMAGWLHGVFVGEWLFVFPLCGFSLSLFCNCIVRRTLLTRDDRARQCMNASCVLCMQRRDHAYRNHHCRHKRVHAYACQPCSSSHFLIITASSRTATVQRKPLPLRTQASSWCPYGSRRSSARGSRCTQSPLVCPLHVAKAAEEERLK